MRAPHLWTYGFFMVVTGLIGGVTGHEYFTTSFFAPGYDPLIAISLFAIPITVSIHWGIRGEWHRDVTVSALGSSPIHTRWKDFGKLAFTIFLGSLLYLFTFALTATRITPPEGAQHHEGLDALYMVAALTCMLMASTALTLGRPLVEASLTGIILGLGGIVLVYAAPSSPWMDTIRAFWPTTAVRSALLRQMGPAKVMGAATTLLLLVFAVALLSTSFLVRHAAPRRSETKRQWPRIAVCGALGLGCAIMPPTLQQQQAPRVSLALQEKDRSGPVEATYGFFEALLASDKKQLSHMTPHGNANEVMQGVPRNLARLGATEATLLSSKDTTDAVVGINVLGKAFQVCLVRPYDRWLISKVTNTCP